MWVMRSSEQLKEMEGGQSAKTEHTGKKVQ